MKTDKLITAMEGMTFQTPKGTMTFRKEDHQAMQSMYPLQDQVDPPSRGACLSWCAIKASEMARQQTLAFRTALLRVHLAPAMLATDVRLRLSTARTARDGLFGTGLNVFAVTTTPVLETRDLTIRFGGHVAVNPRCRAPSTPAR